MRFLKISFTLSKNLVFHRVTKKRKENFGERLKISCEELGISFIKIGQILSMRYDMLSHENCQSLQKLLDKANVIDFDTIASILNEEYGKPYTKVFKKVYAEPLGSASVSQVHKAELFDGTLVAVKIKRPHVEKYIKADLRIMKKLVRFGMLFSKDLRGFRAFEVVTLFESWIRQDVDFRLEVKNIKRLREQGLSNKDTSNQVVCMNVFDELCTDNIIVMDFINGISVSNKKELLLRKDYDVEKSVRTYVNHALQSWFRTDLTEYLFQADPHFSNIIALPDGEVANIDCGLVLSLTKKEVAVCKDLTLAIYLKDARTITKIASEMGKGDFTYYRKILEDDLENYFERVDTQGIGLWFFELTKILIKHNIHYPSYLITVGRANVILDGLVEAYIPDHTAMDLLGDQLKDHALSHIRKTFSDQNLMRMGHAFSQRILNPQYPLDVVVKNI